MGGRGEGETRHESRITARSLFLFLAGAARDVTI